MTDSSPLLCLPALLAASLVSCSAPSDDSAAKRAETLSSDRQRVMVEVIDTARSHRVQGGSSTSSIPPDLTTGSSRRRILETKSRVLASLGRTGPVRVLDADGPFPLLTVDVTDEQAREIALHPEVARVHPDRVFELALASSIPYTAAPSFQQTRARGEGTAVAVIDTPVRLDSGTFGDCPSAGAPGCAVTVSLSFGPDSIEQVMDREDQIGIGSHATNVAAVVHGMAPDAKLISLNVFHWESGSGQLLANESDTIQALSWVADHAAEHGIVAVNTSLGTWRDAPGACNDSASYEPIRALHEAGVLTVLVSGNDGLQNSVRDPGCVSAAVTVGAHFDSEVEPYQDHICSQPSPQPGQLACFSNLNGMVDLVAPGMFVDAGGYRMNGTSQAAPHVAGAIAAWQSWYLAQDGGFRSAAWMQRNLLAYSTAPLIHHDARSFLRLAFDQGIDATYSHAFSWWYRDGPENLIVQQIPGYQEQLEVQGQGWNIGGAYLYLEVLHPQPETIQLSLQNPSGQSETLFLPRGQANFTGIIGRSVYPGAFDGLAGSPVDGSWTLSLVDTIGSEQGHYLQAALYIAREDCEPVCDGAGCGDDGCGGRCGDVCIIDGSCYLPDERSPDDACRGCDPAVDFASWSALEGVECDDGDPCTTHDVCDQGVCAGTWTGCEPDVPADNPPVSDPPLEPPASSSEEGCGCRTHNSRPLSTTWWWGLLAGAVVMARRMRPRRRITR